MTFILEKKDLYPTWSAASCFESPNELDLVQLQEGRSRKTPEATLKQHSTETKKKKKKKKNHKAKPHDTKLNGAQSGRSPTSSVVGTFHPLLQDPDDSRSMSRGWTGVDGHVQIFGIGLNNFALFVFPSFSLSLSLSPPLLSFFHPEDHEQVRGRM
ncbi:hypothetical protein CEXT_252081 [Caerostris extrusa]|uniref:Uncharacterized protein n=1 Tax=Caerostris extrusa TaxID=172846 RepID=A0AAV4SV65_CAEEX|nr:hypothetical protein CEXT_252081 [Caerostris extrusa]